MLSYRFVLEEWTELFTVETNDKKTNTKQNKKIWNHELEREPGTLIFTGISFR